MGYLLGIDLGSSSVKASLLDPATGKCVGSDFSPKDEMRIDAPAAGYAEQDPQVWKDSTRAAVRAAIAQAGIEANEISAVGISYQMHGLICLDSSGEPLRPAIIWCDSRAVPCGREAFSAIGEEKCLERLLNSPGNFTAAKLAWVKRNEPEVYKQIDKIMLPGDWLAFEMSGRAATTAAGLSEGILWDYIEEAPSELVMRHWGFSAEILPETVDNFGIQGSVTRRAAEEFGLAEGTPISYRGGDQPNNALSLNVLEPGEVAATAGTSGVVFGVTDSKNCDPESRFNTFLHVNHTAKAPRLGQLLCINGSGIMNAWVRRMLGNPGYDEMNMMAAEAAPGSRGLIVLPFGNGAERMLGNRILGAGIERIDLNRHGRPEICRAAQEGIAFAFNYGIELMRDKGMQLKKISAGKTNMFQSGIFCRALADLSGAEIELYDTDGALGAARGAGIGSGEFNSFAHAFESLEVKGRIQPGGTDYGEHYRIWKKAMLSKLEDM